tara:strand:- start:100 stop:1128 length:1029 start_codon:yes stop_codon:yes gene_type:complete
MKQIKNKNKANFLKKIFVKLSRFIGYEIIDQNTFSVPTSNKDLNSTISIAGKKSINIPLGEVKITRKIKSLDIIIRTCTEVKMLTQNKERIFEEEKIEYTLRSISSILKSLNEVKKYFQNIDFKIIVVDHNSKNQNIQKIKDLLSSYKVDFRLINLDIKEYANQIKKQNQLKKNVTDNQISNMCNINKSLDLSKSSSDLVYFVEDDYLHKKETLKEMLFAYERISSQIEKELIICPTDYPYLYTKSDLTQIYLGEKYHWRKIDETLCTFLTSQKMIEKYWDKFVSMCNFEHYPFELPLHEIYKKELCISPIPSLAIHCTNINSIFGLSPNVDIKKIWEENKL